MDKKNLAIGLFVSISLILSGVIVVNNPDKTYICESKNLIGICDSLSGGIGTRCYYTINKTKYWKVCPEGWKLYENKETETTTNITTNVIIKANGKVWNCKTENGEINSYTKCNSGKFEGYIGELLH